PEPRRRLPARCHPHRRERRTCGLAAARTTSRSGPARAPSPPGVGEQRRRGGRTMSLAEPISPADTGAELQDIARRLLVAVGENVDREGLLDTPRRVAESIAYLTDGYGKSPRQVM